MLTVRTREGATMMVPIVPGVSLMETIREAGIDELQALCGGSCSCATCHVFVEEGADLFAPMSSDEDDLLDISEHRQSSSRLSCQLRPRDADVEVAVTIAPED